MAFELASAGMSQSLPYRRKPASDVMRHNSSRSFGSSIRTDDLQSPSVMPPKKVPETREQKSGAANLD
jgi:hypothetical protein